MIVFRTELKLNLTEIKLTENPSVISIGLILSVKYFLDILLCTIP